MCHQTRKELTILKLDFEKAFDKVEHELIPQITEIKVLTPKWLTWMKLIFSAILLNGVPGKVFCCRIGVQQGDPLSPLFFCVGCWLPSYFTKLSQQPWPSASSNSLVERPGLPHPTIHRWHPHFYARGCWSVEIPKRLAHPLCWIIGLKVNFDKSIMDQCPRR